MYINCPLIFVVFSAFVWYCCLSYTIDPATDIDGTYDFTALSEDFQINICTNDAGESYMSINAINHHDSKHLNYVFGAFRDLDAPRQPKCDVFVLEFSGFQMVAPPSTEFEAMTYKFTIDTNVHPYKYELSRDLRAEIFTLNKRSMVPLTNCFEPGDYSAITFPRMYKSEDLKGSGFCPSILESCFDIHLESDADFTNSCFAVIDADGVAYNGGILSLQSIQWDGKLSLQLAAFVNVPDGTACPAGPALIIADPHETGKIIESFRCYEGHTGTIHELHRVEMDPTSCPLTV